LLEHRQLLNIWLLQAAAAAVGNFLFITVVPAEARVDC
jgi:hypothetical protein